MDSEAQDSTQSSLLGIRSKKFLLFSTLIHLLLLSFFLKKNQRGPLADTKTIIRLRSENKSSQIKSNKKGLSANGDLPEPSYSSYANASKDFSDSPKKLTQVTFETNYPRLSRILKEEGEVTFKITKSNTKGWPTFEMQKSSGFERLDLAAQEALHKNTEEIIHLIQEKEIKQIRFEFKLSKKQI
jgi:outer membrane biosynthesis protein TonB